MVAAFDMMEGKDGLAPLLPAKADGDGLFPVEHGPVSSHADAAFFQDMGEDLVAAAFLGDVFPKQVGAREELVVGEHAAACHQLVECSTRQDEAAATMGKNGLLGRPHGRAEVVGRLGIEARQEAVHVVPVDVRVQFQEEEPVGIGPHVRRELHHGQELVLVQPPAVMCLLLLGGAIGRLYAVVDVEVWVVVAVLGTQIGEGICDLEAVVFPLAVREDEQVDPAAAEAVEVGGQLRADLGGAYFQNHRHIVHGTAPERRALLAKHDVRGGGAGARGGRLLQHDVVAALAKQQRHDAEDQQEEGGGGHIAQYAPGTEAHHGPRGAFDGCGCWRTVRGEGSGVGKTALHASLAETTPETG